MNKKIYLIIIFFILTFIISQKLYKNKEPEQDPPLQLSTKELTEEQFNQVKERYLNLTIDQSPKAALDKLREETKTDDKLLRSCHAVVHEIGRKSYEEYQDFGEALKYQDEICNSGYLHGVIESHFSNSADIFSSLKNVCEGYSVDRYIGWECYHGVGHGLMYYTSNDLPRSLNLCESLNGKAKLLACVNGIFMENFNTDQKLHPSKFLRKSNPFYPCNEQNSKYKDDCYLYAPTFYLSLHKNEYTQALKWCRNAEKDYISACISGVGSQAIKENINNPKFVEYICNQGNRQEINSCLWGMVSLYTNHYGSLDQAKSLCNQLEMANRSICREFVNSRSTLFTN